MKIGDLVKFSGTSGNLAGWDYTGILVKVSKPTGLGKPIATVFWNAAHGQVQHHPLVEQLEVVSENR